MLSLHCHPIIIPLSISIICIWISKSLSFWKVFARKLHQLKLVTDRTHIWITFLLFMGATFIKRVSQMYGVLIIYPTKPKSDFNQLYIIKHWVRLSRVFWYTLINNRLNFEPSREYPI